MSWEEWASSTLPPADLASAFMAEYERPGVLAEVERRNNANRWYEFLSGHPPQPSSGNNRLKLWMYPHYF